MAWPFSPCWIAIKCGHSPTIDAKGVPITSSGGGVVTNLANEEGVNMNPQHKTIEKAPMD